MDTVIEKDGETRVIVGTPTTGATLDNRSGCAAPPEGWEAKHFILVAAGATQITEADVMPNLWTRELDSGVERIEAELRHHPENGNEARNP